MRSSIALAGMRSSTDSGGMRTAALDDTAMGLLDLAVSTARSSFA